jgi:predicted nuclease of predicted toxin-antitoxin system
LKLKIDENLPGECTTLLRNAGLEADTVSDENLAGADDSEILRRSRAERRVLVTLDLDFGTSGRMLLTNSAGAPA